MKFTKGGLLIAGGVFLIGGVISLLNLFGFSDAGNLLKAQEAKLSAQYHAAQAVDAANDATAAVAEISASTVSGTAR